MGFWGKVFLFSKKMQELENRFLGQFKGFWQYEKPINKILFLYFC
jgi:hypothetical protein